MSKRTPEEVQALLEETAERIAFLAGRLDHAKECLTLPPNETAMLEGEEPYDVVTDILGSIECVVDDCLRPAVAMLHRTATVTADDLAREFRERKKLRELRLIPGKTTERIRPG